MNKVILIIALGLFSFSQSFSQNQKPFFSSNNSLSFEKYISGVRYAEIGLSIANQEQVDGQEGIAPLYYIAKKYLEDLGFEYVALTSAEKIEMEMSVESYCQYTSVIFGGDIDKKSIANMTISFVSCNGDIYSFKSDNKFTYGKFTDVEKKLVMDWKKLVGSKENYKPVNQLTLPSNPTSWTSASVRSYLLENEASLKQVEGMYERVRLSFEDFSGGKYTVGIVKDPNADSYLIIYLSGAKNSKDWKSGEIKGRLFKTSTPGFYTAEWITRDKSLYEDVYCSAEDGGVRFFSSGVVQLSYTFIKTFPVKD